MIEFIDKVETIQSDQHQTIGDSAVTGAALKCVTALLTRCLLTLTKSISTANPMSGVPACMSLLYTTLSSVCFGKYALPDNQLIQLGRKRKRILTDALIVLTENPTSLGTFCRVRHLYSSSVVLT